MNYAEALKAVAEEVVRRAREQLAELENGYSPDDLRQEARECVIEEIEDEIMVAVEEAL